MEFGMSGAKLKDYLLVKNKVKTIFIIAFVLLQAVNLWNGLPDYADETVFGFPFFYLQLHDGDQYSYFDAIMFIVDMAIVYIALRIVLYAYRQINKFSIPKEA